MGKSITRREETLKALRIVLSRTQDVAERKALQLAMLAYDEWEDLRDEKARADHGRDEPDWPPTCNGADIGPF